jgi:hypothetical protein
LFTDWHIALPPIWERHGDRRRLRDLIAAVVSEEVHAFQQRQQDRRLARVMSRAEIEAAAARGRIDSGETDLRQEVDEGEAVAAALQAFTDGLYFVFIDGVQQTRLDDEVFVKPDSKVLFLRLTALVGG